MTFFTKYSYISMLILSILIYAIPFEFGGYLLRAVILAAIIFILLIFTKNTGNNLKTTVRMSYLLWIINSIILFHLLLIFIYLVINPSYVFILGSLIGMIIFWFVTRHLKRTY